MRLINSGVSAETLKIVMRHEDFATTERHYGAVRSAQQAGQEHRECLTPKCRNRAFVGGPAVGEAFSEAEVFALKRLLGVF